MATIVQAMRKTWAFAPPKSYAEMHRAKLFTARDRKTIKRWIATGQPEGVMLVVFEMDEADAVAKGNEFVRESVVPGFVPIGGDGSGDAWCFDTRKKIGGTTPVVHVPHDGGGGVYVAPSFAGFVYRLILENLQYMHFYEDWKLTREDMIETTRRNVEAAAPWLLERWQGQIEQVLQADDWPTFNTLPKLLARDTAFARLPKGELDIVH